MTLTEDMIKDPQYYIDELTSDVGADRILEALSDHFKQELRDTEVNKFEMLGWFV